MIKRVMIDRQGGPELMQLENAEISPPGPEEAQIEQTAIGLNYMDVYQRSGHYPLELPSSLGLEAAGRVVAVGESVSSEVSIGDRVVYGGVLGA
ncbi:MAG: alcohol dehydrogenase catalytic domain-containing protein [Albidovulum sp.]|nr:alcohol dehydrogenase catalytic domain-containing protein [Albidovulum sp.]